MIYWLISHGLSLPFQVPIPGTLVSPEGCNICQRTTNNDKPTNNSCSLVWSPLAVPERSKNRNANWRASGAPIREMGENKIRLFVGFSCICNNMLWHFGVLIIPKWLWFLMDSTTFWIISGTSNFFAKSGPVDPVYQIMCFIDISGEP